MALKKSSKAIYAVFLGNNLVSNAIVMVSGFLMAKLTVPELLGMFSAIGLAMRYADLSNFGVQHGLARELPYWIGKRDKDKARSLSATGHFVFLLIAGAALIFFLVMAAVKFFAGEPIDIWLGWVVFGVFAFFHIYTIYLRVTYRTSTEFATLSKINIAGSVAGLVLLVALLADSYWGLYVRRAGIIIVPALLFFIFRPMPVRPKFRKADLVELLKTGFPIFAVSQLIPVWLLIDKTILLKTLGTAALGLYYIPMQILMTLDLFTRSFQQFNYPRLTRLYGKGHEPRFLVFNTMKHVGVLLPLMAVIAAGGWFLGPPLIEWILPNYAESTDAVRWAFLAAFANAGYPVMSIFAVIKRQQITGIAIVAGIATYAASLLLLGNAAGGYELVMFVQALFIGRVVQVIVGLLLIYVVIVRPGGKKAA